MELHGRQDGECYLVLTVVGVISVILDLSAGTEDQRPGQPELPAGPGRGHGLRLPGQLQLQRGVSGD